MQQVDIPKAVKEIVLGLDPGATLILYGSRARGDAQPDSDWDFMVVHNYEINYDDEIVCRRKIHREVELEYDVIVSVIHRSVSEYESDLYQAMPLHQNIRKEGITV